jgi:hypothetical protein
MAGREGCQIFSDFRAKDVRKESSGETTRADCHQQALRKVKHYAATKRTLPT